MVQHESRTSSCAKIFFDDLCHGVYYYNVYFYYNSKFINISKIIVSFHIFTKELSIDFQHVSIIGLVF